MDKAPAYGAGDSGFESQYGLNLFLFISFQNFFLFACGKAGSHFPKGIPQNITVADARWTLMWLP